MFGLIWGVTARTHYAVRRFMPTNVVLDAIHTRRGLKWGVPAMLLAVPYVLATVLCAEVVDAGGTGWLNVLALLFAWNALKFLVAGPATLIRLIRVRGREAREQRRLVRRSSSRSRVAAIRGAGSLCDAWLSLGRASARLATHAESPGRAPAEYLLYAAGLSRTRPPPGGSTMTIPQEQFDDLLSRTALAALFYYPEIAVDDDDYRIHSRHCILPGARRRHCRRRCRTAPCRGRARDHESDGTSL